MSEKEKKIEQACTIWHTWFEDDTHDYSESEASDVEYFIGVMMYNHFAFSKALSTMQTMDIGLDFKQAADSSYVEVYDLIGSIKSDDELELLVLLQNHIKQALEKYGNDRMACYLLDRLNNHIKTLAEIYAGKIDTRDVNFERNAMKHGL